MKIWVGEELMLDLLAVIFFCIYFYVYELSQVLNTYKVAAGIWHEDRFRPLITAIANLVMNLIFVQFWGIYGVLASTFISTLVIGMPWLIYNLFSMIFEKKQIKSYVLRLLYYTVITACACGITYLICDLLAFSNDWVTLIVRLAICLIIPNIIFYISYRWCREYKGMVQLINKLTKGKIRFLNKYENM